MILVDTSVWIEVFRRQSSLRQADLGSLEEFVTCLPVVQEVLQGFREETAFHTAREAMLCLPIVESPLRLEVFEEAAQLFRAARRAGLTIRSGVDCLIAACALRHRLTILHYDRDFDQLSEVSALKSRRVASRS